MNQQHDSVGDDLGPWGTYMFRLLLSIDQFINVIFAGFPDESLSGRLGRAFETGKPKWFALIGKRFVDWLFLALFGERNHCVNAMEPEDRFENRPEFWKWYYE